MQAVLQTPNASKEDIEEAKNWTGQRLLTLRLCESPRDREPRLCCLPAARRHRCEATACIAAAIECLRSTVWPAAIPSPLASNVLCSYLFGAIRKHVVGFIGATHQVFVDTAMVAAPLHLCQNGKRARSQTQKSRRSPMRCRRPAS